MVGYYNKKGVETIQIRDCPYCGSSGAQTRLVESPFVIVRCRSCKLVYLGNPPNKEGLYDEYHSTGFLNSRDYRLDSTDPQLQALFAINQQRITRIKYFKPGGKLLDIGCGRGYFLQTARKHGYLVQGIDLSERAIGYAQWEFKLDAEVQFLEDVVASGQQFDVVTLWHVLEHFANPFETLEQIKMLLVSGGICFIEVPNLHSLKFMLSRQKWEGGNHPLYHRTFFTAGTLRRSLERSGFAKVQRLRLVYHIPGRNVVYESVKRMLNLVTLDAFLDFVAWK